MESLRAGRTRYLVVVSRPINTKFSPSNFHQPQKLISQIPQGVSTKTSNNMTKIVLSSSSTTSHSNTENIYHQCSTESKIFLQSVSKSSLKSKEIDCDISNMDNVRKYGIKKNSGSKEKNTVEECCLLGIDCNEMTTVGLVLKVLADTSIRLDGDG